MSSIEDYNRILQDLSKDVAKQKYTDLDFPPNLTSFCNEEDMQEEFSNYQFIRSSKIADFYDNEGSFTMPNSKV